MIDYVMERLEKGASYDTIRRMLGIQRATDKSWKKIMSAIKQGFRVDGPAHLMQMATEYRAMSQKLRGQIMDAFEEGIEVPNKDGGVTRVRGPSKELSMAVDAFNRLNQGFIKNAKDLGAYVEQDGKGSGGGGVTIVVQTNVPLPAMKDVEIHKEKERAKNEIIIEQGRNIPDIGKPNGCG